ncbi:hypothetical protein B0H34DRAFT_267201 [Crassisporium funariophilum]|nr:hypothetical protein B0H34DRAFT_267201 [Crassisporium funariophilum]
MHSLTGFSFYERFDNPSGPYHLIYLTLDNQGVVHFSQLADDSDEVPNLKGKSYSDFRLQKSDWARMQLMHDVLQVCTPLSLLVCNSPLAFRSLRRPNRRSQVPRNQLSGAPSPFSSSYYSHGRTWLTFQNTMKCSTQSGRVLRTSTSGIAR